MRNFLFILSILISFTTFSQELKCDVVVNAQQTGNENVQVFKTLENQLNEFVNNTQWTNKTFALQERINCSMVIIINDYDNDTFRASIQIRSSRPIFNSSYSSPVYNFNDRDFTFKYLEFQNLNYNSIQFESNLVSVIAYHIYIILAMDADTFSLNGGEEYYAQARSILSYSQQSNFIGWKPEDGLQSRFSLIDNIMSPTYKEIRSVLYNYHIDGLDNMNQNPKSGKDKIAASLMQLEVLNNRRPNSFILRVFFDAKAEEIEDIFSDGPSVNITDLATALTRIAPMHTSKWRNINF
ncbi:MAG: DUF4835 domain-containing protein [Bacteroidetes bacterium]|nr:MAG: DUF4835 domain-containing protein [Bacteroidota bacterium]